MVLHCRNKQTKKNITGKHQRKVMGNFGGRGVLKSRGKWTRREAFLGEIRSSATQGSYPGQESWAVSRGWGPYSILLTLFSHIQRFCDNGHIQLTQCCTQFKSPKVKILCVLYLHYNVSFTFKWYEIPDFLQNVLFTKGLNWVQHWVSWTGLWPQLVCSKHIFWVKSAKTAIMVAYI